MAGWKPLEKELSPYVEREHNQKTRSRIIHKFRDGTNVIQNIITEHTFSGSNRASRRAAGNYRGFSESSAAQTKKT